MTQSFSYRAQTRLGEPLSGMIEAASAEDAGRKLELMQLHVLELAPPQPAKGGRTLSAEDLIAFNQQLVHLTTAGLPLERGLRLIAEEMRSGRLAGAIRDLADDLEKGTPIEEALKKRKGVFPASYARVLEAGVKSGSLPGVLLNLSRHLDLMRRLRSTLWRTLSYPAVVLIALAGVLAFLSAWVIPGFDRIFRDFHVSLPEITQFILGTSHWLPPLLIVLIAVVLLAGPLIWLFRRLDLDGGLADLLLLRMPLIGGIVRRSAVAGWCDSVRVGVEASMDLPGAIALASAVSPSRLVRDDGRSLELLLESGKTLEEAGALRALPPTVPVAVAYGTRVGDLPATLRSLTDLYEQQADVRVNALPGILTPILLILLAVTVGLAIFALLAPMITLIGAVSGS